MSGLLVRPCRRQIRWCPTVENRSAASCPAFHVNGLAQQVSGQLLIRSQPHAAGYEHEALASREGVAIVRRSDREDAVAFDGEEEIHVVKVQVPEEKHDEHQR